MTAARTPRVGALDLLRGLTVAAMIVVNNPGNWNAVFTPLSHAAWNGVTVADLIFPGFILIMGVAMQLSLGARRADRASTIRAIVSRGLLLVAMGLVLNLAAALPHPAAMRIPGVLQRIGLTYMFAALLMVRFSPRSQQAWIVALLGVHTVALLAGPLEPGINVAARIDRAVFGTHLLTPEGDPEGLLGLLTCTATALMGAAIGRVLVGHLAREDGRPATAALRLAGYGAAGVCAGIVLSRGLPFNKALWTASFAMLTSGAATAGLAICLLATNAAVLLMASPLFWLGTNPLAIYFLSELTTTVLQWPVLGGTAQASLKDVMFWDGVVPAIGDHGGAVSSLAYGVAYTLLWIGVAGLMKWRGIRIKV